MKRVTHALDSCSYICKTQREREREKEREREREKEREREHSSNPWFSIAYRGTVRCWCTGKKESCSVAFKARIPLNDCEKLGLSFCPVTIIVNIHVSVRGVAIAETTARASYVVVSTRVLTDQRSRFIMILKFSVILISPVFSSF